MSEGQRAAGGPSSPGPGLNEDVPETPPIKEELVEVIVKEEEEQLPVSVPESTVVCENEEKTQTEAREDVCSETEGHTDDEEDDDDDDDNDEEEDDDNEEYNHRAQTRRRSKRQKHRCPFCEKIMSSKLSLKTHIRVHTGDTPYSCSLCDKAFCFESKLKLHMRAHTGEKPYRCSTCKAAFAVKNALKVHMRIHTGEKPYNCSYCVKTFTYKITYDRHMETHTKTTQYSCSFCSSTFLKRNELSAHIKTHRRGITFNGFTCQMDFTDSSVLKAESEEELRDSKEELQREPWLLDAARGPRVLLHRAEDQDVPQTPQIKEEPAEQSIQPEEEQPPTSPAPPTPTAVRKTQYSCSFCSGTFPTRKDLNAHIKTHRGGITFNGFICQIDFSGLPLLSPGPGANQVVTEPRTDDGDDDGPDGRTEACPICPKRFGRKDVLRRHIKAHSGDMYSCSICHKAFTRKYTLQKHLRRHAAEKLVLLP